MTHLTMMLCTSDIRSLLEREEEKNRKLSSLFILLVHQSHPLYSLNNFQKMLFIAQSNFALTKQGFDETSLQQYFDILTTDLFLSGRCGIINHVDVIWFASTRAGTSSIWNPPKRAMVALTS